MASNKEEIVDSPTGAPEAPKDHRDEQEPSLASYATIVGIVTGLFGMLLTVGFILLPSATLHEKGLVIGASLAVSVAGLTGVGAWRSPRKFGLTMLAVGLAVACLVDLSMTAADRTQTTLRAAGRLAPRPSTTPSPSPTEPSTSPSIFASVGILFPHGDGGGRLPDADADADADADDGDGDVCLPAGDRVEDTAAQRERSGLPD